MGIDWRIKLDAGDMLTAAAIISILILWSFFVVATVSALGVDEYGSNYIIWNTTGDSRVIIDGTVVNVSSDVYGQYELDGGTTHYISDMNHTIGYKVTTTHDLWSMLGYWGVLFAIYGLAIVAFRYPVTAAPGMALYIWLLVVHLPSIHADNALYALETIGVALCVFAGIRGYQKG